MESVYLITGATGFLGHEAYVSSVHAIEEAEKGKTISETTQFSASRVEGIYGKNKAEATAYVLKAAERGLDASIVHPSGIIGPGPDIAMNNEILSLQKQIRAMQQEMDALRQENEKLKRALERKNRELLRNL